MNDKILITKFLKSRYSYDDDVIKLYREKGDNGKRVSRVFILIEVKSVLGYSQSDLIDDIIDEFLSNM